MARARIEKPDAPPPFKTAILFSPTAVGDPFKWFATGEMQRLKELPEGLRIETPATFIWGNEDRYKEEEGFETTFERCNSDTTWKYVFSGGHEVPHPGIEGAVRSTAKLAKRAVTKANENRG